IKGFDPIGVIYQVREQLAGVRQLSLADAGTLHRRIRLPDVRRSSLDSGIFRRPIERSGHGKVHGIARVLSAPRGSREARSQHGRGTRETASFTVAARILPAGLSSPDTCAPHVLRRLWFRGRE